MKYSLLRSIALLCIFILFNGNTSSSSSSNISNKKSSVLSQSKNTKDNSATSNSYATTNYPSGLRVIIIRHAEKPDSGSNLSCKGLNRALELSKVLYNKYKLVDHIYTPQMRTGEITSSSRMYQTIVPYAVKYNLNIDSQFNLGEEVLLAKTISNQTGIVLIVWKHKCIPNLIHALGIADTSIKWKEHDFDSIWIISYQNGKAILSFDKENISPSTECN